MTSWQHTQHPGQPDAMRYAAPSSAPGGGATNNGGAGEYAHHVGSQAHGHAGGYNYESAYVKGQTTPPHDAASATAAYHHASPSSPARGSALAPRATLSQRVPASAPAHTSSHPTGPGAQQHQQQQGYYAGYPYYGVQQGGEYPQSAYPGAQGGAQQQQQQGQGQGQSQAWSGGAALGHGQPGQAAQQQAQGRSISSGSTGYATHGQHQSQQQQQQQQAQQAQQHAAHHQPSHGQHPHAAGAGAQHAAHPSGAAQLGGYAAPQAAAWQGYAYGGYGYPHYQAQAGYGAYAQDGQGHAATPTSAGGAHWSTAWPGASGAVDSRYGPQSAGIMPGYTRDAAGNPVAYGAHMMQGTLPGHDAALGAAAGQADYAGLGKRASMEDSLDASLGKKRKGAKGKPEEMVPIGPVEPPPQEKSHLHPPPQARSAWQIFFADRLNEAKANVQPGDKLNVAHVAKDAGSAYAQLAGPEKEHYAKKAQEARDQYAIDLAAWQATLTPEDVRIENAFRANQRKAGKSRKGNLKDPNAPKKPLSAYFLFLKAIRSSPELTRQVFEGEVETTKQSMLAAKRWRGFSDDEKKPYLKQAELDKAEYDNLRKEYEEDAAARARGETVADKPHVEPSYAKETVSPRLLAAVLPHVYGDVPTIMDVEVKPAAASSDNKSAGMLADSNQAGEADQSEIKDEHAVSPDDIKADETMDESSDNILHNLGLPDGLDLAANFDLNNGHDADEPFAFHHEETPVQDEPADDGPKLEVVNADDAQADQSPQNAKDEDQSAMQTVSYTNVHQDGSSTFVESVMVSSNVPDLLPTAEEPVPAVVEPPAEDVDDPEPAVEAPQVEELPVEAQAEITEQAPLEASADAPVDASAEPPAVVQEEPTAPVDDSAAQAINAPDQPSSTETAEPTAAAAAAEAAATHAERSRSPTPDAAKIEAAQELGVTAEEALADPEGVAAETAPPAVQEAADAEAAEEAQPFAEATVGDAQDDAASASAPTAQD